MTDPRHPERRHLDSVSRRWLLYVGGGVGLAALLDACTSQQAAKPATATPAMTTRPSSGATAMATTEATAPPSPSSVATSSAMLCREAWGARPARPGGTPQVPNRMTVHHSAVVLGANSNAPARIRADQRYHQDSKGWIDIAYHVGVDRNGNIYELRDPGLVGDTATTYDPTGHFLVLCEGDYDQETVTEEMLNGVARACAWAAQRYSISVDTLAGHRGFRSDIMPRCKPLRPHRIWRHRESHPELGRHRRRRPAARVWARSDCTSRRNRGGQLTHSRQCGGAAGHEVAELRK